MLNALNIENIAVIERTDIEFTPGFNILTGETGAGKSIVIDAIHAVLGERTTRELVRTGTEHGSVSALFSQLPDAVVSTLEGMDLSPEEDGTLLIQRRISADGKSVCKVNGRTVTAGMLREIGRQLVNIHGQHDSQTLLDAEQHYRFLDMLAEDRTVFSAYSQAFRDLIETRRDLRTLLAKEEEAARREELLAYQVTELEAAGIQPGELAELEERRRVMLGSESIREALQGAYDLIHGSDEMTGAYLSMQNACNLLEDALRYDSSLAELLKKMQDTLYSMEAHRDEIRTTRDAVAFEPQELEEAEERISLLKTLVKKYGGSEAEALAYLEQARRELDALHHAEERLEQLGRDYDIRLEAAVEAADRLHKQRRETAARFKSRIQEELAFLDMPHVAFEVAFAKGKLSATGYDQVEFLISANPGEPPKPIRKIASGGELSRIMLAIRNIIADSDAVGTLIFDEIDAGVSGRASEKIGRKLRQVSRGCQVLCVTHAAQIAAQADSHYSITKAVEGGRTYTQVHLLDQEARVEALARIMGGAQLTPAILESAREMLEKTEE